MDLKTDDEDRATWRGRRGGSRGKPRSSAEAHDNPVGQAGRETTDAEGLADWVVTLQGEASRATDGKPPETAKDEAAAAGGVGRTPPRSGAGPMDVNRAAPPAPAPDQQAQEPDQAAAARAEAEERDRLAPPDEMSVQRASALGRKLPLLRGASRLRGMVDSALFFSITVVGTVLIAVLKGTGVDSMVVAGLAVAAMVAYGVLGYVLPGVRLRPDKLGDNLYYMGFVFTLTSMSVALVALQRGADVSSLIGSFGIGLFTTIAGIAGRVLLLQMRTEVEDVEEIVRRDLLEHADRLRGQLTAAVDDLETFRLGVRQAVERQLSDALHTHEVAIRGQLGAMEQLTEESLGRLCGAYKANEAVMEEMRASVQGTVKALRMAWERLAKIEPPSDILDRKLDGTMTRIIAAVTAFEDSARAEAGRHRAMTEATEALGAPIKTLRAELSHLGDQAEAAAAAGQPIARLGEALITLRQRVEEIAEAISAQQRLVKDSAEMVERHQVALNQTLQTSQENLYALQAAVTTASSTVTAGATGMGEQMREVAGALSSRHDAVAAAASEAEAALLRGAREMEEQLRASSEKVRAHREEVFTDARDAALARQQIASDLAASRAAVLELQRSMVEVTRAQSAAGMAGEAH